MGRVYTKKARKDYPKEGIKKGDTYFSWYAPRTSQRVRAKLIRSKTRPKPSQMTSSEFLGTILGCQEDIEAAAGAVCDADSMREFGSACTEAAGSVREQADACGEKFGNMPEGLQQGDTGQLLEARRDKANEIADTLERIADEAESWAEENESENGDEESDEEVDWAGQAASFSEEIDWDVE